MRDSRSPLPAECYGFTRSVARVLALRKDKYDRKLIKYYVEYEEDDEEVDMELEKEVHTQREVRPKLNQSKRLQT